MLRKSSILLLILLIPALAWGGVEFDDTDDLISCGDDASLDIVSNDTDLTISMWVKPYDNSTSLFLRVFDRTENANDRFAVYFSSADYGEFMFDVKEDGVEYMEKMDSNVTINQWYHVVGTWDASANTEHLYIDNTSTSGTGSGFGNGTNDTTTIGARAGATPSTFDGQVTEVAIWNTILTSDEIEKLYLAKIKHMPIQIQPSNLVAYWPMDDEQDGTSADGDTFADMTNTNNCTGNDGTNNTGLTAKAEEVLSYP